MLRLEKDSWAIIPLRFYGRNNTRVRDASGCSDNSIKDHEQTPLLSLCLLPPSLPPSLPPRLSLSRSLSLAYPRLLRPALHQPHDVGLVAQLGNGFRVDAHRADRHVREVAVVLHALVFRDTADKVSALELGHAVEEVIE